MKSGKHIGSNGLPTAIADLSQSGNREKSGGKQ
jgi:hypothetical protein